MAVDPESLGPFGCYTLPAATAIADAIDDAGAPPAGNAGDVQFNKGDGTFTNAAGINASSAASLDGSGNMAFLAAAGSLQFVANNQYTAGASKIVLNAGGDVTLEKLDSTTNPETLVLDSDLSTTHSLKLRRLPVNPFLSLAAMARDSSFSAFTGAAAALKPTKQSRGSSGGNAASDQSYRGVRRARLLITDSTT